MDQYVVALARAGHALLLDCRDLTHVDVAVPNNASFVVLDTGVRRELAGSEYNRRRASCDSAVAVLSKRDPGVGALRDVAPDDLAAVAQLMDSETYHRARHVVDEIGRPKRLTEALNSGDLEAAGRVINESHASLRDLYEVSCVELDEMTELARSMDGCYGARMTGAGFGGCAVALVEADKARSFVGRMRQRYSVPGEGSGYYHICVPSDGTKLV